MPPVRKTIALIELPIGGFRVGFVRRRAIRIDIGIRTDAMGQRVVRIQVDAVAETALEGKEHAMIILRASINDVAQNSDLVRKLRPL